MKLTTILGLGVRRILNLHRHYPQLGDVFHLPLKRLCEVNGIDQALAERILSQGDEEFVTKQLQLIDESSFNVIHIFAENYPARLKQIYDPPVLLYYYGALAEADCDAVAVVGTRHPSRYGREITARLARELAAQQITVVSGFARGIDTEAHQAALQGGGRTIAVLGNGIDCVYPSENRRLRDQIIDHGVYCSEFPLGTQPDAVNFPRRNRIIAGLSLAVLVVEAGQKSGALITAYYALDQNREVLAIPGRIDDPQSQGTNLLIQKGAKLIRNIDDILAEIDTQRRFATTQRQLKIEFQFDRDEKKIYDALEYEPIHIDELCRRLECNSYDILATLLALELKGYVRQFAGKMFARGA